MYTVELSKIMLKKGKAQARYMPKSYYANRLSKGWTPQQIADELNCSRTSIYNALRRYNLSTKWNGGQGSVKEVGNNGNN